MQRWIVGFLSILFLFSFLLFKHLQGFWLIVVGFIFLGCVAARDMLQTRHSIRRNFPIVGHFRYLFESIRPEINQYFIESNNDGVPFNRETRSVIYQRAKQQRDTLPFGTRHDVYASGYECIQHSIHTVEALPSDQRVLIGGAQCRQPYNSSIFITSAMSFGALSEQAIESLVAGAKIGGFAQNTGEGGISKYHLKHGGDLVWQIGTGYFGARDVNGRFDPNKFTTTANLPSVKMVEIKLSQGAKPSLGGLLPAAKVTEEIAKARGVPPFYSVVSPSRHSAFEDFAGLCEFISSLRELSGGKPIGIKLCLGRESEFETMIATFISNEVLPDYIAIDGAEGGTGAAPLEFSNHVGMPLYDAITTVHKVLEKYGIRESIRIVASGKISTGFDIVRAMALGADLCASARGMMMALGCIQALRCDSNKCPAGIATQDAKLTKGLVVEDKSVRVAQYQKRTVASVAELLGAMGLKYVHEIEPNYLYRRCADGAMRTFEDIYGLSAFNRGKKEPTSKLGVNKYETVSTNDYKSRLEALAIDSR